MSLRRSKSALYSLHRFLGVDVVVFCEGGDPLEYSAILKGQGAEGTLDILYWSAVKQLVGGPRRTHFKSVGGKSTLTGIAADIIGLGISTIAVCMDSDYDPLRGQAIADPRIAYTYGYSWENDVCHDSVVEAVGRSLIPPSPEAEKAIQALVGKVQALKASFPTPAEIDFAFVCRGKPALFDRDRAGSLLSITDQRFVVCSQKVRQRQRALGYGRRPNRLRTFTASEMDRWAVGKVVLKGVYLIFDHLFRTFGVRMEYPLFARLLVAETSRSVVRGDLPQLATHMRGVGAAFV